MAIQQKSGLTYADLETFPEDDNLRRELIDGKLFVTATPRLRHQEVVANLVAALWLYARENGGKVYPAPTDVFFSEENVVEPDVVFVGRDNLGKREDRLIRGAPEIVIEVSSPSTRRLELVRKRELYERYRVPEYWYVDLEADRVEMYRLDEENYGAPEILGRFGFLESALLPGFTLGIDRLLGEREV